MQPLDLWNPHERGGIGWPGDRGLRTRRHRGAAVAGTRLADRPATNDDLLNAVRELELAPLSEVEPWVPPVAPFEDLAALRVDAFGPYFRGIRFGTMGLASRLTDEHDRAEAIAMSRWQPHSLMRGRSAERTSETADNGNDRRTRMLAARVLARDCRRRIRADVVHRWTTAARITEGATRLAVGRSRPRSPPSRWRRSAKSSCQGASPRSPDVASIPTGSCFPTEIGSDDHDDRPAGREVSSGWAGREVRDLRCADPPSHTAADKGLTPTSVRRTSFMRSIDPRSRVVGHPLVPGVPKPTEGRPGRRCVAITQRLRLPLAPSNRAVRVEGTGGNSTSAAEGPKCSAVDGLMSS